MYTESVSPEKKNKNLRTKIILCVVTCSIVMFLSYVFFFFFSFKCAANILSLSSSSSFFFFANWELRYIFLTHMRTYIQHNSRNHWALQFVPSTFIYCFPSFCVIIFLYIKWHTENTLYLFVQLQNHILCYFIRVTQSQWFRLNCHNMSS